MRIMISCSPAWLTDVFLIVFGDNNRAALWHRGIRYRLYLLDQFIVGFCSFMGFVDKKNMWNIKFFSVMGNSLVKILKLF